MSSAIIVGAGVFGASLADRLAGAGWDVTLVEQYQPGHVRQSSGGESRLIRFSHRDDEWHTALSWRSRTLWMELEADTGTDVFEKCGLVWFGRSDGGWETASLATMTALGIPAERIDQLQLAALFPSLNTDDLEFGVHEPDAGVLRAAFGVQTLAKRAVRRGATLISGRATPRGDAVVVDGTPHRADVVVWACGPWLQTLFPDLVDVHVSQQDVLYFGAGPGWSGARIPGWIEYDASIYGTGDIDGKGFKVSSDADGPAFDPDTGSRVPLERNVALARSYLGHRFPALADAPLVLSRTCQYTVTPDAKWIVAPHPEVAGHWIYGAGSGHGFKHGPALAEYMEGLLTGADAPDERFGLGPRIAAPNLRSAQPG